MITLEATQSGKVSTFSYNWLSFCNSSSRIGVAEQREPMQVRVLGNPVLSERVELEIRGVVAESVRILATDQQGRTVHETSIKQADEVERATVELGRSAGMYLLRVSTPTQQQVIKLIRQ
ncbi:T9SS type A sorting domain-containing protein [Spirosoma rhododendri]|uniref:T9SS type A sorting domain-containing protein n=1 Tax=Spirosoma rhododendri TaxID=2728024 RepID=A0A7L5DT57_9BACT|nr:T9SS type A sorting domain-containing protein [Spirosoma rhododendri]QJD78740.1 T9SS type A sorting domain-containing protein [Spirosoma rhododendri]